MADTVDCGVAANIAVDDVTLHVTGHLVTAGAFPRGIGIVIYTDAAGLVPFEDQHALGTATPGNGAANQDASYSPVGLLSANTQYWWKGVVYNGAGAVLASSAICGPFTTLAREARVSAAVDCVPPCTVNPAIVFPWVLPDCAPPCVPAA